jgi:hypothetical protein
MIEKIYTFRGLHGFESRCKLRIFDTGDRTVVIATELEDNPGTTITNYADQLATQIIMEFNIKPDSLIWIEHYPARPEIGEQETFDLISFKWNGTRYIKPEWYHIEKSMLDKIIGEDLPEEHYGTIH